MKIIINADDFGMCRGVNHAVADACRLGVVRSASLLPGGRAFDHAVQLAHDTPELGVGVHLTLTFGSPLLQGHQTLTDPSGRFRRLQQQQSAQDEIDPAEVEREFTAQIEKVLSAGIVPTHLDSHHHIHMLPHILPVFLEIARRYRLPVRLRDRGKSTAHTDIPSPDIFVDSFHGEDVTEQRLCYILTAQKGDGVMEIMCHPAYLDQFLCQNSSYNLPRIHELTILTSETVARCVRGSGIQLVNYRALGIPE